MPAPEDFAAREALAAIRAHHAGGGGVYLGRTARGWAWSGEEHATLVLGPPRSGKTTGVVVPSIVAAEGAVVSTSTKPDIAYATIGLRRRIGPCLLYDPTGSVGQLPGAEPARWSPVASCRTWDGALITASALVETAHQIAGGARRAAGGDHWSERAGALLAPLLHAAAVDGAAMAEVLGWIDRHEAGRALEILERSDAAVAGDLLAGIASTDPREQSGIWSTASGALAAYRSQRALASTVDPNFDATAFVDGAATLYICATGRHQATVAPLVAGLLGDVRAAVYARAASSVATGLSRSTRPPATLFALDEVANIAPLPDLPAMVSEGGGQGLVVLACLQDLSQARARWGTAAEGFLSLFGTTLVLPGIGDIHTLRTLSELAGEHDVVDRSISSPVATDRTPARAIARRLLLGPTASDHLSHRPPTTTLHNVARRRLSIDEAAHGKPGSALVIDRHKHLHWIELTPWFATEPWRCAIGWAQTPRAPAVERLQAVPAPAARPAPAPIRTVGTAGLGVTSVDTPHGIEPDIGGPAR